MRRLLTRLRSPRSGSRGVALVEAAFVFPVVLLVTMAVIEFGLIYATESTTVSSAQAGARLGAATIPLEPPATAYDAIRDEVVENLGAKSGRATPGVLWIYDADPDGTPQGVSDFSACATNCVRYTWDGSSFSNPTGTWPDPDACLSGGLDRVGVYVSINHQLVTGLLFDDVDIDEHTTAQLEPVPTEQCP